MTAAAVRYEEKFIQNYLDVLVRIVVSKFSAQLFVDAHHLTSICVWGWTPRKPDVYPTQSHALVFGDK